MIGKTFLRFFMIFKKTRIPRTISTLTKTPARGTTTTKMAVFVPSASEVPLSESGSEADKRGKVVWLSCACADISLLHKKKMGQIFEKSCSV